MHVLRCGRSAYETEASLSLEAAKIQRLGGSWQHAPKHQLPNDAQADVLVANSGVRISQEALEKTKGKLVIATTAGVGPVDLLLVAKVGLWWRAVLLLAAMQSSDMRSAQ